MHHRIRDEIAFYDLAHPDRLPQRVPGGFFANALAVSPNGGLVSASALDGQVRLFDAAKGELIDTFRGHLNPGSSIAFSPDGRRLFSIGFRRELVKLWDVGTAQELLTLTGIDAQRDAARWSADGDVILAGLPWQAWSAPSWEEIEAVEAKDPPSSDFGGQGRTESKKP